MRAGLPGFGQLAGEDILEIEYLFFALVLMAHHARREMQVVDAEVYCGDLVAIEADADPAALNLRIASDNCVMPRGGAIVVRRDLDEALVNQRF